MVIRKDELEIQLKSEHQLIKEGVIRDDAPLDTSEKFAEFCNACRRGDLRACQECIASGVNINARDEFDYTPLILASLCGHYEVVRLLLESGALCERDTFSGERCLYNALTDRIRVLLLKYDYSKSTDPLQPLASHITGLLTRTHPQTSDITLRLDDKEWKAHKFILAARSPYFAKKLAEKPETKEWKLAHSVPAESFGIALRYLYLGDVPTDLGLSSRSTVSEEEVLKGIDKVSKHIEMESLWDGLLAGEDRRVKRQRQQDEVNRGRNQLEGWFRNNVVKHRMVVDTDRVEDVKWNHDNSVFADVILCAHAESEEEEQLLMEATNGNSSAPHIEQFDGIPVGPRDNNNDSSDSTTQRRGKSVLYPCHRAMLLRSEYFLTMFTSGFLEAQPSSTLRIITVDCPPEILEIILTFLYTEKADFGLEVALDVLYAADMLLIERLKNKAALVISTLGTGKTNALRDRTHGGKPDEEEEEIDILEIMKAAYLLNVQRLEEFAGRYLAYHLENYIDEPMFAELIKESASRVKNRQETDTIELLDDIRYYLSERFRLRFEDLGLHEMGVNLAKEAGMVPKNYGEKEAKRREEEREKAEKEGLKTIGGETADDEFSADALNYQALLDKLDNLLERLKLDA